jgi:hypothetical protein
VPLVAPSAATSQAERRTSRPWTCSTPATAGLVLVVLAVFLASGAVFYRIPEGQQAIDQVSNSELVELRIEASESRRHASRCRTRLAHSLLRRM